jgi:hypothetical protein
MRHWFLAAVVVLSACSQEPSPEERAREAERAVEMVMKANNSAPPLRELTPEPILLPDIERHDLYGASCAYAPGTSLGMRVFAREADAFVKIDGEVERFAADSGSRQLPQRTRSLYNSGEYTLQLQVAGEGTPTPDGKGDYEGTVTLRDAHGRVVYEGGGLARCGA